MICEVTCDWSWKSEEDGEDEAMGPWLHLHHPPRASRSFLMVRIHRVALKVLLRESVTCDSTNPADYKAHFPAGTSATLGVFHQVLK